jgi:hypothetical protein
MPRQYRLNEKIINQITQTDQARPALRCRWLPLLTEMLSANTSAVPPGEPDLIAWFCEHVGDMF